MCIHNAHKRLLNSTYINNTGFSTYIHAHFSFTLYSHLRLLNKLVTKTHWFISYFLTFILDYQPPKRPDNSGAPSKNEESNKSIRTGVDSQPIYNTEIQSSSEASKFQIVGKIHFIQSIKFQVTIKNKQGPVKYI